MDSIIVDEVLLLLVMNIFSCLVGDETSIDELPENQTNYETNFQMTPDA